MDKLQADGTYYMYLRKSRADKEAEERGEGETLARHEALLRGEAERLGIKIRKIYREIVSGETIADRPVMQQLLEDIGAGNCDGVLVTEVERLARGDTSDQGIVARYFKFSSTLIITPSKIYNPDDEFDEEFLEFGLFMSRREYKTINRRIQRGRTASVKEGKWIASKAPFGYKRVKIKDDKGYTLEAVPEQAEIVKLIFELYTKGEKQDDGSFRRLGYYLIAKKINAMGVKTTSNKLWTTRTISDVLKNLTYIGKVCWGKQACKKTFDGERIVERREINKNHLIAEGLHPAIIDIDIFNRAQNRSNESLHVVSSRSLKNPLSGILKCGKCGKGMTRAISSTRDNYYCLKCPNPYCNTVSAPLDNIEIKLIESLKQWIDGYKLSFEQESPIFDNTIIKQKTLSRLKSDLKTLESQKTNAFDFLEQGVYTVDVFKARSAALDDKISSTKADIKKLNREIQAELKKQYEYINYIPAVEDVLSAYWTIDSPQERNNLLCAILERVEYTKDVANTRGHRNNSNFALTLYPKIPKF